MRQLVVLATIALLLITAAPLAATDKSLSSQDPLEGLSQEERQYVAQMRAVYSEARRIGNVEWNQIFIATLDPLESLESLQGSLNELSAHCLESPPPTMVEHGVTSVVVAQGLRAAFSRSIAHNRLMEMRNPVIWGLTQMTLRPRISSGSQPIGPQRLSDSSRSLAHFFREKDDLTALLNFAEAELDALIARIQRERGLHNPLTVTIAPESVRPGESLTLTVRVSPPLSTRLTIVDWGPLEPVSGTLTTDLNGILTRSLTVKTNARDGAYTLTVEAPELGAQSTAAFRVSTSQPISARIAITTVAIGTWERSDDKPVTADGFIVTTDPVEVVGTIVDGTFTADFDVVLDDTPYARGGIVLVDGDIRYRGSVRIDLGDDFESVESFSFTGVYEGSVPAGNVWATYSVVGGGMPLTRERVMLGFRTYTYYHSGAHVCADYLDSIAWEFVYHDGVVERLTSWYCDDSRTVPDSVAIQITIQDQ